MKALRNQMVHMTVARPTNIKDQIAKHVVIGQPWDKLSTVVDLKVTFNFMLRNNQQEWQMIKTVSKD